MATAVTATGIPRSQVERFREAVAEKLGLAFDDGRLDELGQALAQRVEASRSSGGLEYLERLTSGHGWSEEWRALAARLTVGETYFFRYRDHFRAFSEAVIPSLQPQGHPLRILSAGCASGEEAYTIAILLREHSSASRDSGGTVLRGIDVNPLSIERAVEARYSPWALREVPPALVERYFRRSGKGYVLLDTVRTMAEFGEANLLCGDPALWGAGLWDVVFCRNVLMYLAPEAARSIVGYLEGALRPGGFLFLGHAETLRALSDSFHLRHTHDTFYYQRRKTTERTRPPAQLCVAVRGELGSTPAVTAEPSWVDAIRSASSRIASLTGTPSPEIPQPPTSAAADLGLTLELFRQERFGQALERLRSLPPDRRADADAQLLHAALLTHAGGLAEAEQVCRELLERDEMNAGAHYLTSLCREHAGDRLGALEHDRAAVYLDPSFAMPHLHLGLLAKRTGDLGTARRELGQAVELLAREEASRILLFGGGFGREALIGMCRAELAQCGAVG